GVLVTAQDISALRRQERAENARSAIFQKMVTNDTLLEVLPLLGAYLEILTPEFRNAMAFKPVPGDDPLRACAADTSSIETCL
uniref:hypothetical protein n=1 Tax=Vibrio vulnificus TaxID=672 RepID=UPI0039B4BEC5